MGASSSRSPFGVAENIRGAQTPAYDMPCCALCTVCLMHLARLYALTDPHTRSHARMQQASGLTYEHEQAKLDIDINRSA